MSTTRVSFEPLPFASIVHWPNDNHAAAFAAFVQSASKVLAAPKRAHSAETTEHLLATCREALSDTTKTSEQSKAFFEARFTPHRVVQQTAPGLVTGYYEPVIGGSRKPHGPFNIPVYRRPPDLENLVAESERGAMAGGLTHMRRTNHGLEPYATREQIECGALEGLGLELVWLKDPIDTFFMHVQGSGRIALGDGSLIRITYDGKNGLPYTSIGRYVIDQGYMNAEAMTLDALKEWLSANPAQAREVLWQNESFVFFRELSGEEANSPLGAIDIPLREGRSLAVDTAFHALGTPVFVSAPTLTHATGPDGFHRLMIAHDVGSAIRGPERGDIYFGSGHEAGRLAGSTKHAAHFVVLLPNAPTTALQA